MSVYFLFMLYFSNFSENFAQALILYGYCCHSKLTSYYVITKQTFALMKTSWRRLWSSSSEDFFKTSSRRLDQDEYIRLSHTSWEDVLVKTNIFVLAIRLQDVFKTFSRRLPKTSSRHLQDVFKTSSRRLAKTSSRPLQDVFKASSRPLAKIFSRSFQDASSS